MENATVEKMEKLGLDVLKFGGGIVNIPHDQRKYDSLEQ